MQAGINKKILVAYFSYSGNTREIANQIHKSVGGDIFGIQSGNPYPHDYDAVVQQAKQELDSKYKPTPRWGDSLLKAPSNDGFFYMSRRKIDPFPYLE